MANHIGRAEMLLLAVSRLHRLQIEELQSLEHPLTLRQYRILQRVGEGYASLSELSKLSHRSLPSTSESVDGLIRRKLLTRRVSTVDRRAVELTLTDLGRQVFDAGTACLEQIAENFFARLPASKQATLEALSQNMYRYSGELMAWPSVDGH
jgi:DNA-binding MarR family transcriptional regulator